MHPPAAAALIFSPKVLSPKATMRTTVLFVVLLLCCGIRAQAQIPRGPNDTIRLGGVIVGKDTFAMVFLDELEVMDKLPRRLARQRAHWDKLRYNVAKVYPYAVVAAEVLRDVDVNLDRFGDDKHARKAYLKNIERELNKRWKGELSNLTISQGQVLVKLIDRQTGKNCFSIIKEMKGGLTATVWQGVALLFANNLKREYDPYGEDKDIERIVRDIELQNYYRYKAATQGN
jgi:hypothetical protein